MPLVATLLRLVLALCRTSLQLVKPQTLSGAGRDDDVDQSLSFIQPIRSLRRQHLFQSAKQCFDVRRVKIGDLAVEV